MPLYFPIKSVQVKYSVPHDEIRRFVGIKLSVDCGSNDSEPYYVYSVGENVNGYNEWGSFKELSQATEVFDKWIESIQASFENVDIKYEKI